MFQRAYVSLWRRWLKLRVRILYGAFMIATVNYEKMSELDLFGSIFVFWAINENNNAIYCYCVGVLVRLYGSELYVQSYVNRLVLYWLTAVPFSTSPLFEWTNFLREFSKCLLNMPHFSFKCTHFNLKHFFVIKSFYLKITHLFIIKFI